MPHWRACSVSWSNARVGMCISLAPSLVFSGQFLLTRKSVFVVFLLGGGVVTSQTSIQNVCILAGVVGCFILLSKISLAALWNWPQGFSSSIRIPRSHTALIMWWKRCWPWKRGWICSKPTLHPKNLQAVHHKSSILPFDYRSLLCDMLHLWHLTTLFHWCLYCQN